MKKRILAILLSGLMLASMSACNCVSNNNTKHETSTNENDRKYDPPINSNAESSQVQDGQNSKITLSEYQELVGCYVTTKSGENLKYLMSKDEAKIKVEQDAYDTTLFHITSFQNGTECKTSISLSKGVRTPDIYSGFTSEQNGYVIIFHMEGYAVSPMDDVELACVLRTADGGKTWDKTEYSDFRVSNGREYISAACFFTKDVGFFTARYTNTDHFGPRTYWTVDGGKTWINMSKLAMPNFLQPFGIYDDFSSEISDFILTFTPHYCMILLYNSILYLIPPRKTLRKKEVDRWTCLKNIKNIC